MNKFLYNDLQKVFDFIFYHLPFQLAEDGSSSSSGSSSGYGSQNAIKIEDKNPPPPPGK